MQQHTTSIMSKIVVLAVYRHKPKRVLADDVRALVEVSYGPGIAGGCIKDAKAIMHGKKVPIKSLEIKSKIMEAIAADPSASSTSSYQKIPKTTIQYVKGVIYSLVGAVVSKAIASARAEGRNKLDSKHISAALSNNLELFRVFPEKAFQSRVN